MNNAISENDRFPNSFCFYVKILHILKLTKFNKLRQCIRAQKSIFDDLKCKISFVLFGIQVESKHRKSAFLFSDHVIFAVNRFVLLMR